MSSVKNVVGKGMIVLGLVIGVLTVMGLADAQSGSSVTDNSKFGLAVGAGLAVGLAGLGTGLAQKDIGAAAVGAVAEDAGFLGRAILFIAIPETIVIFGVLISFLLLGKITA